MSYRDECLADMVYAAEEIEEAMFARNMSDKPEDMPDYDIGDMIEAAFDCLLIKLEQPSEEMERQLAKKGVWFTDENKLFLFRLCISLKGNSND